MDHRKLLGLILAVLIGFAQTLQAQVITSLTPHFSEPGKTVDVLVRSIGTHFQNGVSVADFGNGIKVLKLRVANQLTATATIQIEPGAVAGERTVTIQTGGETAGMENGFRIITDGGEVRANLDILPIESISLSDVDISVPEHTPILLFVNVYNDSKPRAISLTLHLTSSTKGYIGNMTKKAISLTANQYLRISNRDFNKVNLNGTVGNDFLKAVKILGTFPPDDYLYKLEVFDDRNILLTTDESRTTVSNPRYNPELITPGAPFDRPIEDVYMAFPLFQWFGQMDKYDISLYEVRTGQTPEEVVRNIHVFQQKDVVGSSLLYPAYAEKLKPGKIYAWQVLGKINTGRGVQALPSEVYRFRYSDPGASPTTQPVSRIELNPQEMTLKTGEQFQFTALLYGPDSSIIPNVQPQWQLSSPDKGTIGPNGLFTAGKTPGTIAVIAKKGVATEYAVVNISGSIDGSEWLIDQFIRQLFGLPPGQ